MKTTLNRMIFAISVTAIVQTASAAVLLSDNFLVSSNSQNVNQELSGRQTGPLAPAFYTGWAGQHQIGNSGTDVGQPGGATNSNFVLVADNGSFFSDLNIASLTTGPVTIEFDMYVTGTNNPNTDPTTWGAVTLRFPSDCWPIVGTGEFGFIARVNGGIHMWDGTGDGITGSWDTPGFATNTHWALTFSDLTGTGSAFNGNGSQVTFVNGTNTLGTVILNQQLSSAGLRLGFRSVDNRFIGIDNLQISGTPTGQSLDPKNLSFEDETTLPGRAIQIVPTRWTAFNMAANGDFGSQNAGAGDYSANNPLASTADGNNFCYINKFNGQGTGGIYQDFGPLQPNTTYTLTVAIGSRADRINSPGILSLVNGTDDTGTVLATGGGLPATQDTWQDYSVSYSTGGSVSGDLTVVLSVLGAGTIQGNFDNVRLTMVTNLVPTPLLLTNPAPASATIAAGSNVIFTAAFSNVPPVSIQWQQVVSGSPGATNDISAGVVNVTNNGVVVSTLTINNAQLADGGAYRVKAENATNAATFIYSSSATLTVIPTITWYAAGTYNGSFSDNSVLALAGPVANEAYGINFGVGLLTTANGYTFDDYASSGNMTLSGTYGSFGSYLGSATTGDANLDLILNNGMNGGSANTATLNNLTVGQNYTVLVLLDDTRTSGAGGSTFHATDGLTVSPSQTYAFPNGVPAIGGYIMGTFTARSTSQPLTVVLNNGNVQYNAILLVKGFAPPPPIPPTIASDIKPLLQRVTTGNSVALSATAQGSLPLHYQWFNQTGAIADATNSSYTFSASAGTNSFYVNVTNAYGSINSSTGVVVSASSIVTVNNFSFEADVISSGTAAILVPSGWNSYLVGSGGNHDFGVQRSSGTGGDYTVANPLAPTADGNNFLWINKWNGNGTQLAGAYQDVGPLQPNTAYTLTVAIGNRADAPPNGAPTWSPGIISLVNGTDNTGTVLATISGVPSTPDTWQDFTVSFTTGASVSGDLTILLAVQDGPAIQADFDNVRLTRTSPLGFESAKLSGGNLILTGTGGTPGSGYTVLSTTNLAAPILWITNTTGTFGGSGEFTNSIPVDQSSPGRFFRIQVP